MIKLPNHTKRIKKTNEVLNNPYIGFTSFQHFRNDPLFSDCGPKGGWMKERYPVYAWVEQNGREQGYYPETEIAYFRVLWKDFEVADGEYNFALIDDIFKKARECNQSVMLRLMPHNRPENEDVPDWLFTLASIPRVKERGGKSPTHPIFLERFAKAIEVLGNRYDSEANFYAMDISLVGPWGEGMGFEDYPEKDLKGLVDAYTHTFKRTNLLGQICSPELVNYANLTKPVGFRADGLGEENHMGTYFPKNIFRMKDVWQKAPVSFESFYYLNEWKVQGWDIDEIIDQTLKWHISSINGKSSAVPIEWKDKIDKWLKKMGYRFSIRLVEYPDSAKQGDVLQIVMWIENSGCAPLYNSLPFSLRLKNQDYEIYSNSESNVTEWMPGDTIVKYEIQIPEQAPDGIYYLECRLGGGEYPVVKFAMDAPLKDDGYYVLTNISLR